MKVRSMIKKICLLTVAAVLVICRPSFASETISGTYISQINGRQFVFTPDGDLIYDGNPGRYVINGDSITIMINGTANKYTYEFLDDLLILYDSTGTGEIFEQEKVQGSSDQLTTEPIVKNDQTNTIDFEDISKSVLLLSCYNGDELVATASGFVAFDGSTIVTNNHVIEGITKIIATNEYGLEIEITDAENYDTEKDLAILTVHEDTGLKPLPLGDSSQIKKGEEIYTIGSPEGLINTVSSGLLSGEITDGDKVLLQISAPISSGSSGGVLLNKFGKVIGVTSSGYIEGQNLNFAIPINDVITLHNQEAVPMPLSNCYSKDAILSIAPIIFGTYPIIKTGAFCSCNNLDVILLSSGCTDSIFVNDQTIRPENPNNKLLDLVLRVKYADSRDLEMLDNLIMLRVESSNGYYYLLHYIVDQSGDITNPKEAKTVHFYCEVPNEIVTGEEKLQITILNGQERYEWVGGHQRYNE